MYGIHFAAQAIEENEAQTSVTIIIIAGTLGTHALFYPVSQCIKWQVILGLRNFNETRNNCSFIFMWTYSKAVLAFCHEAFRSITLEMTTWK